jgi:hypothetical protein
LQAERLDLVEHPVERALVRENSAQESVLTLSVGRQDRERLQQRRPERTADADLEALRRLRFAAAGRFASLWDR